MVPPARPDGGFTEFGNKKNSSEYLEWKMVVGEKNSM